MGAEGSGCGVEGSSPACAVWRQGLGSMDNLLSHLPPFFCAAQKTILFGKKPVFFESGILSREIRVNDA